MASVAYSEEQASILRHMLGIDRPDVRQPDAYRDYYCADPGDGTLLEMERLGLVERYSERGGYVWYRCTASGRAAAWASHKAIMLPKAKRVYLRYLSVSDAFPDLTFKEFLTAAQFAQARREA
jgi:hypothetical protein